MAGLGIALAEPGTETAAAAAGAAAVGIKVFAGTGIMAWVEAEGAVAGMVTIVVVAKPT